MSDTEKVLGFLKQHRLAVVSTIDRTHDRPEAACVAFAEMPSLELVFGTMNTSRKYANLQSNPHVSFVIGWSDDVGTIQYEGVAKELGGDEALWYGEVLADKNENARKFITREGQRYFLVTPTWIRLVDKSKHPEEVLEISF